MKGYIQWVGGAIMFALIVICYETCNKYKHESQEQSTLITAYQDSIKRYHEKDGSSSTQIALLEGSKENLLQIIGKSNLQLTKLLKKGASSGTSFEQVVKFDTITTIKIDTIKGKSSFSDTTKNKWLSLIVTLKDDSLRKTVNLKDSIAVSFQKIKQGFLKPKKSVVVVTNLNPYVTINGLRSFTIPQKKSNLKFWFGAVLGAATGYLLFK